MRKVNDEWRALRSKGGGGIFSIVARVIIKEKERREEKMNE